MKKTVFALISLFFGYALAGQPASWMKTSGWKDVAIYAAMNGGTEEDLKDVTPNTMGAYWAGHVTEFYWDKSKNSVTKIKIRVTWSSDRGEPCGSIVVLPLDGVKDFNFRSLAMKKCV